MVFNNGFEYLGVRYGWKAKQLYRLPYSKNLRTYGLKLINPHILKNKQKTVCYNICRIKKTINQLEILTEKVNWEVKIIKNKDVPF